jgi:hypothetical protein
MRSFFSCVLDPNLNFFVIVVMFGISHHIVSIFCSVVMSICL